MKALFLALLPVCLSFIDATVHHHITPLCNFRDAPNDVGAGSSQFDLASISMTTVARGAMGGCHSGAKPAASMLPACTSIVGRAAFDDDVERSVMASKIVRALLEQTSGEIAKSGAF